MSLVKMETKNPVGGYFGSEFPAICNNCGVMAACKSQDIKNSGERQPHKVKFSEFCSKSFHRDTDRHVVFKCCEIWPMVK